MPIGKAIELSTSSFRFLGRETMTASTFRKTALAAAALVIAGAAASAAIAQKVVLPPKNAQSYAQDRAEIEELMSRYLFAIDYFDWDAYVGTFTEDGILTFASGTTQGRENIRATVVKFTEGIAKFYHTEDGK